ncbi:MAG: hypothetical protein ACI4I4_07125 [Acutalibacteraceae bacterium]
MYAIRDIEEIKERLLSFGKYNENAAPDVLVTLIHTFAERIYITDENDERHCHIFIKGCSKEYYDDFFRATGYIEKHTGKRSCQIRFTCVIQISVAKAINYLYLGFSPEPALTADFLLFR